MECIKLCRSDLEVSRLGVGGCPMGGHGWGPVDRDAQISAVQVALDRQINFFDTADVYGLGRSELLLGEALRGQRHRAVIATKCGVRVENGRTFYDNSPDWIRRACEGSLRRLGTDYIDLYQLHYRDDTPFEAVMEALLALRDQGKVRYLGLSNVSEKQLKELKPWVREFASVQMEYSLARRGNEALFLALPGLTPMTWGSLGQGILTGKYGPETVFSADDRRSRKDYVNFHGNFRQNLSIVRAMEPIAQGHNVSLAAVAVRFILDRIPGSLALCGVKGPEQLLDQALGWHLSAEELAILDKISTEKEESDHDK